MLDMNAKDINIPQKDQRRRRKFPETPGVKKVWSFFLGFFFWYYKMIK